jgi:serine/threonine protein kinase
MGDYPRPYGDYVLLERVGVGGMSQIDLARKAVEDSGYVRFVVIKRVKADRLDDESFIRMFKDEARITAELHHNNIAQVYDFGRMGNEYYMAMEFVPGIDLRRVINVLRERGGHIPIRIGLRILHEVLGGLGYAHERVDTLGRNMHIVHRDVNPRNVMISTRGEVKLIDFGVAKATHRLERTRTDHVKGKFAYMAPEQISAGEVDHRADLFAVGLLLHEIVTGYGPFYGLGQVQIMHRLLAGRLPDLPPPPDLPNAGPLIKVHKRALLPDPKDRYQNAAEFQKDLERIGKSIGGMATHKEVAALLRNIDPLMDTRIKEKVATYSGSIAQKDLATVPLPSMPHLALPQEEPVDDAIEEPSLGGTTAQTTVTRTQIVAGGMAIGAGMAVVIGVAIAAIVTGGLYAAGVLPLEPAPEPTQQSVGEIGLGVGHDAPSSVGPLPPPAEREEIDTGDSAPAPSAVPTPKPTTVASEAGTPDAVPATAPAPSPRPRPAVSPKVLVVPKPAPAPIPVPVAAPAPEPEPAALAVGRLQVTAAVRGRPIFIDGERTRYVTPAKGIVVPIGEHTITVDGVSKTVTVREDMVSLVVL